MDTGIMVRASAMTTAALAVAVLVGLVTPPAQAEDEGTAIAAVRAVMGHARVSAGDSGLWTALAWGDELRPGDTVIVESGSSVEILLRDGSYVLAGEGCWLELAGADPAPQLVLHAGEMVLSSGAERGIEVQLEDDRVEPHPHSTVLLQTRVRVLDQDVLLPWVDGYRYLWVTEGVVMLDRERADLRVREGFRAWSYAPGERWWKSRMTQAQLQWLGIGSEEAQVLRDARYGDFPGLPCEDEWWWGHRFGGCGLAPGVDDFSRYGICESSRGYPWCWWMDLERALKWRKQLDGEDDEETASRDDDKDVPYYTGVRAVATGRDGVPPAAIRYSGAEASSCAITDHVAPGPTWVTIDESGVVIWEGSLTSPDERAWSRPAGSSTPTESGSYRSSSSSSSSKSTSSGSATRSSSRSSSSSKATSSPSRSSSSGKSSGSSSSGKSSSGGSGKSKK